MSPEFQAKWGKALKGEESLQAAAEAVKAQQAAAPKPSQPKAQPSVNAEAQAWKRATVEDMNDPVAGIRQGLAAVPDPAPAERKPFVPQGPPMPEPMTYGRALGELGGIAGTKAAETVAPAGGAARTQANIDAGAARAASNIGAMLPSASATREQVMALLRRAKGVIPTPDEVLETGKAYLGEK